MGLKAAHGWAKLELKVFLDTSEALKSSLLSVPWLKVRRSLP